MDKRSQLKQGLHHLYLPYYETLCALLPEEWLPYSGVRDIQTQAELYARGRTQIGDKVTNSEPGYSAHNYGCATDWTIFKAGRPLWEHDRWPEYREACVKAGVDWGGEWSLMDKPHNQLRLARSYRAIGSIYKNQGEQTALAMIESLHKT